MNNNHSSGPPTQRFPELVSQVERLNAVALACITEPAIAREALMACVPLHNLQPGLQWLWHVLLHACNQREAELAQAHSSAGRLDRPRELHTDCSGILLLDEGGGMPIELFPDPVAVAAFVSWLHRRRTARDRESAVARRRTGFRVVEARP